MKVRFFIPIIGFISIFAAQLSAHDILNRTHTLEDAGQTASAREVFAGAVKSAPKDAELLRGYAAFLERYGDPGAREAYRKAGAAWNAAGKAAGAVADFRSAVLLDLIAGDRKAAETDAASFKAAGGKNLELPPATAPPSAKPVATISIPGPIRSFARMAAISGDVRQGDLLPALARNVVTNGFQASHSNDALEQTEYLKLVHRYVAQARELDKFSGPDKVIKIAACESTETGELLRILGFRMRGGCGAEVVLETVNAPRAFLSTDSGFPIADLETALRTNQPFIYDYHPALATVLYGPEYWATGKEKQSEFIDIFLSDPQLCRFYLGMSKLDPETAETMKAQIPVARLRAYAHVIDFFGGNFEIRNGKAIVPGGQRSYPGWTDLTTVSPDKGAEFIDKLMAKDDGWLASLYDALCRIKGPVQDYLTEPARMKRYYTAVRGRITTPGPARPVFRANADMMLLTTRLRIDADGKPHIPGNLEVWKQLFVNHPHGKYDAKLTKLATTWKEPDDVIEALFALCRKAVENEPLKIFMALSDVDRARATPMAPNTVDRLARNWKDFGAQYTLFNDAPMLSDKAMLQFMDATAGVDKLRDQMLRQDQIGMLQGLLGMWQIMVRQGSIAAAQAEPTFTAILTAFTGLKSERELFDAGRTGLKLLLSTAGSTSGGYQERVLVLLAGGAKPDDSEARVQLVREEQRIMDAQKLLSADLLFELSDNLEGISKGEKLDAKLASRLSARLSDILLPRSAMSGAEKNALAFGYYVEKHIDNERKLNLRAVIDKAAKDADKIRDIRGALAPLLRDTLVGYNYVHYAPPGAQILFTNPLFVRGHDFIGMQGANHSWRTTELFGTGWPSNAGGRLVGSLAGLPYAIAEAEQNFLIPSQTQALIWGDLVPQMILTAKIPRFWSITPAQLHWVGMHMRLAENLVAEAAVNPAEREPVTRAISQAANPFRASIANNAILAGDAQGALETLTPSEMFRVASALSGTKEAGNIGAEIKHYRGVLGEQVSDESVSRAWGTPKPTLANSYRPELLNLRTFPTLMGYSSRIMAESWESNLLYWADLADQHSILPSQLNILVPEWTHKVVERIFASHLEDWPALLKSLRSVGVELKTQKAASALAALE